MMRDNLRFKKLCKYSECYAKDGNNKFEEMNKKWKKVVELPEFKETKGVNKGLYIFIVGEIDDDMDDITENKIKKFGLRVLYVGATFSETILHRAKQHFNDTYNGSFRAKLTERQKQELLNSVLYVCLRKGVLTQKLHFEECRLIGKYRPKFNYLPKSQNL